MTDDADVVAKVPPRPPDEDDRVLPPEPDVIDSPPPEPRGLVVLEEDE